MKSRVMQNDEKLSEEACQPVAKRLAVLMRAPMNFSVRSSYALQWSHSILLKGGC